MEPHRHHPAGAEQVAARLVVEERVLAAADGLRVVLPGEDLPVAVEDLAGAARRVKELCLPPSCHMIWPVCRSTLKTVHVFRELTSRLPSVSRWTALMWNQSQGVLGEGGRAM